MLWSAQELFDSLNAAWTQTEGAGGDGNPGNFGTHVYFPLLIKWKNNVEEFFLSVRKKERTEIWYLH